LAEKLGKYTFVVYSVRAILFAAATDAGNATEVMRMGYFRTSLHYIHTELAKTFLSRVSTLTRDIDTANLSVCLSVRP